MNKYSNRVKKIIYLNVVFLLVFLLGASLAIWGFSLDSIDTNHLIILESVSFTCVGASLTAWMIELKILVTRRAVREESENGEI